MIYARSTGDKTTIHQFLSELCNEQLFSFIKTCDPWYVALFFRNYPALLPTKSDRIFPAALLGVYCVLLWNVGVKRCAIRPKSQKIVYDSVRYKEYVDVSYCPTRILFRIHV